MAIEFPQERREGKSERGFASMDAGRQREIASKGGEASGSNRAARDGLDGNGNSGSKG